MSMPTQRPVDVEMFTDVKAWRCAVQPLVVGADKERRDSSARARAKQLLRQEAQVHSTQSIDDRLILNKRRYKSYKRMWDQQGSTSASSDFEAELLRQDRAFCNDEEDMIAVTENLRVRNVKGSELRITEQDGADSNAGGSGGACGSQGLGPRRGGDDARTGGRRDGDRRREREDRTRERRREDRTRERRRQCSPSAATSRARTRTPAPPQLPKLAPSLRTGASHMNSATPRKPKHSDAEEEEDLFGSSDDEPVAAGAPPAPVMQGTPQRVADKTAQRNVNEKPSDERALGRMQH